MITTRMDPVERLATQPLALRPIAPMPLSSPAARAWRPGAPLPVLAAVADDAARASVLAMTEALARERGAKPSLLAVAELDPVITPDGVFEYAALADELADVGSRDRLVEHYRAALHLGDGAAAEWPLDVELGGSALCILERARRVRAELIVMGLVRHGRADRLLGTDTLHNVLTLGGGPVLAVRPTLTQLPSRVLAAVDFSPASIHAAKLARSLMADEGTLHLAFVDAGGFRGTGLSATGLHLLHAGGVDAVFAELIEELEPTPGIRIAPLLGRGAPAAELTRLCEAFEPDLLTLGQRRHPLLERLMLGSTSHALVQDGRWSVLLAPE